MHPGFIDLQVNGYRGVNFSETGSSEEQYAEACRGVLATGTDAFLVTVMTNPAEVYRHNLPLLARLMDSDEFQGRVLGFHIEGPFISPEPGAVGMHPAHAVRDPDPAFLEQLQEWADGKIRLLTIAAERRGADELCRHATHMGIAVSLGHQLAQEEDIRRLADAGATALTHLGNGIPNLLPRHPNAIWAGLAEERLAAMLIADGHHLPASVLKTMVRAKGVHNTIAISDAAFLAGMPPGNYSDANNDIVIEPSGKVWNPRKGCLVCSSAMMIDCLNHLAGLGFLELDDLLAIGARNPLRLIGVDPDAVRAEPRLEFQPGKGFALKS